jgi:hypothetical protein
MITDNEIFNIAEYFKIKIKNIKPLGQEYFYNHLPLCVINAVWSIGVKYEGVQNVVIKYYKKRDLIPYRDKSLQETLQYPQIVNQEPISVFLHYLSQYSFDELSDNIFENHQRTSSKSGILKAEAVVLFAKVLSNYHVDYFQDIATKIENNTSFEHDIKKISGQKSGISLDYFFMLSGNENKIKPDRMIKRFLSIPLKKDEKTISTIDAQDVCQKLFVALNDKRITSVRHLDNIIWNFQRNQKK